MGALGWLVLVIVVAILVPFVIEMFSNWDYKRQVQGKRAARKPSDHGHHGNQDADVSATMDSIDAQYRNESRSNVNQANNL